MDKNLFLYHIFNTVAHYNNISTAARHLYISQPAVSKSIKKLETNLNTLLFYRGSKGVVLTQEGELLYKHTKKIFNDIEYVEDVIRNKKIEGLGSLHIGVSSTLCKHILLPYLKKYTYKYPHVKLIINSQSTYHTLKLLENNTLDIGLIAKPNNLARNFEFIEVDLIQDVFVATPLYLKNFKLRNKNNDFFSNSNIMLLDKENLSRKYLDEYLKSNNIFPSNILEVSNMDLLIEFAKTSIGIAGVVKEFVTEELRSKELLTIPLNTPIGKRQVGFVYLKNKTITEAINNFVNIKNNN